MIELWRGLKIRSAQGLSMKVGGVAVNPVVVSVIKSRDRHLVAYIANSCINVSCRNASRILGTLTFPTSFPLTPGR